MSSPEMEQTSTSVSTPKASPTPTEQGEVQAISPHAGRTVPRDAPGSWLSYAVPISIALIAILGAVVGYRVERHAANAGEYDQDALAATITQSRDFSDALTQAREGETAYNRWLDLGAQAGVVLPTSSPAGVRAGCLLTNPPTQTVVGAQEAAACELQQVFATYDLPSYDGSPPSLNFDAQGYITDFLAFDRYTDDLNVSYHVGQADQERHAEVRMMWLGLALAAALTLCTLAQLSERRRWKVTRVLPFAVPGWCIAAVCTVLLVVWDF
jgi:hypothetical protein